MNAPAFALLSTLSFVLSATRVAAQVAPSPSAEIHCSLVALDPLTRANKVPLIVEGEVLESRGFRGTNGRIFTANRVRVYKLLKGTSGAELTLITEGGTVGLDRQVLTNTLSLTPGEQGVFFLEPAAFPGTASAGPAWAAYASQQGFVRYELSDATAAEPFRTYPALDDSFYQALVPGAQPRLVQTNPALETALRRREAPTTANKVLAPTITTLAPLTITAGTGAVLTISGAGFGNTRGNGSVEFRNADDGGASYTKITDADYVSWSDNQIRVLVPSYTSTGNTAGTGTVRVTTTDQQQIASVLAVTIIYAATNAQDNASKARSVPGELNQNTRGGYTFRFDAGFAANTAASAAWQRALISWRCQTGVNWEVGATRTKTGVEDDGENSVGFDSGTQLPANVLGRTTSYYTGCYLDAGRTRVSFYVKEIDTQFDDASAWQFGPGNPTSSQVDFESVALHELGHAQQLSHLILPRAVMHYAVSRGQVSRTLNTASDVAGGRYVLRTRSFVNPECGGTPMLPAPLIGQFVEFVPGVGTVLQWSTRDECFLSGFVVERATATDTTAAGWQVVGNVAAGVSGGAYRFTDAQPLSGLSYYRLRVRRPDNSLDKVVPLVATDNPSVASGLEFYPTIVEGAGSAVRLQYQAGASSGALTLRFYDMIGRYLGGTVLNYQPGLNILPVTLPPLRSGTYVARWTDSNGPKGKARLVFIP
ncbi:matrixin family metalloprotease [Hymenobacter fodinae]|uniref:Matrixin family metalloprotease n=1 Tax=Hymenobacter fodinae TaxID=2510796 RepID=A0A4Z0P1U7_9BACT|nr:matrixin family metalloprotease [Hymenobacter fodinae]TGE05402.1 matrixin family metalloprotease [Hymenobacter fodinae]